MITVITKERSLEVLRMNIQANMLRIEELLSQETVFEKTLNNPWATPNRVNVELRQRMKLLRRDTLKLEQMMKGDF